MSGEVFDKAVVAPPAGAWIETFKEEKKLFWEGMSLPLRERGLKLIGFNIP